jgi:formylglycine-generating enzyme required for sulfatase activity
MPDDCNSWVRADESGIAERHGTPVNRNSGDNPTNGQTNRGITSAGDEIAIVDMDPRYVVENTLRRGAMGDVLLATDTRLGRKVVIKRLAVAAAANRPAVDRFLLEAKTTAAINHPNIAQIHDYGRTQDGPFLVMEYVDGGSLLDRCKQGPLPLEAAIGIACQLCDGLAKAHDLGIVHHALEPANVLLTQDGVPKLVNFGCPPPPNGEHCQASSAGDGEPTHCMPPEQRLDAPFVEHRSNVWSLGAMAYQMVTGHSPHVIRLHDLPQPLQPVLARALEDLKENRHAHAAELRDALGASLRAAPAKATPGAVVDGQCPACSVQNAPNRRFCRGCGAALESPCLDCGQPMPSWEDICGACGGRQGPLATQRQASLTARQAEAERLLDGFEFERALAIAASLRNEADPRLPNLSGWADGFVQRIEEAHGQQLSRVAEAIEESGRHESAHDYLSAIFTLESVPVSLRATRMPNARETVAIALARLKEVWSKITRLEVDVKDKLASGSSDGLLPAVEALLALEPDREDMRKLRGELVERRSQLTAARDEAVRKASALLSAHDYDGAVAVLAGVTPAMTTPEATALGERATTLAERARSLAERIQQSVAAKRFDGLILTVEEYLRLKPNDQAAAKLRHSLVAREEKLAHEIAARLEKSRVLQRSCRFKEARELLDGIPQSRRPQQANELLVSCTRLEQERLAAMACLRDATRGGHVDAVQQAARYARMVAAAGIADEDFAAALNKGQAEAEIDRQLARVLRVYVPVAAAVVAAVLLVAGGVWLRTSLRAWAIKEHVAAGNWDAALSLDPKNVAAYAGRIRAKLAATPPDIAGAFADLDQAGSIAPFSDVVTAVRAEAIAARAAEHARADRLDEASRDLAEADRLTDDRTVLSVARQAIAAAWLAQADRAADSGDEKAVRRGCETAETHGAASADLARIWLRFGERMAAAGDFAGLQSACTEARKQAATADAFAGLWQRLGAHYAKKLDATNVAKAVDEALAAGVVKPQRAEIWVKLAEESLAKFDIEAATNACDQATALGHPAEALAAMWMAFATSIVDKGDAGPVNAACDAARRHGADRAAVTAVRVRSLLVEAEQCLARGKSEKAGRSTVAAMILDREEVTKYLNQPEHQRAGMCFLSEAYGRFRIALETHRLQDAAEAARLASGVQSAANEWLKNSLTPGWAERFPAEQLPTLSPGFLRSLAPETIAALPRLRNSIGMEFKLLPAGTFIMGDSPGETDEKWTFKPAHRVTLTRPFCIGAFEVTNAQWKTVMGRLPSGCEWDGDTMPVTSVGYREADDFCRKLSELEAERGRGWRYRLPTEAEWEYACRAGTTTRFSFGENWDEISDYGRTSGNNFEGIARGSPASVGTLKPNPWGLYDMHGNVSELVSDRWSGDEYQHGDVVDPQGSSEGSPGMISRGGNFSFPPKYCRSAFRISARFGAGHAGTTNYNKCVNGLRVAFILPEHEVSETVADDRPALESEPRQPAAPMVQPPGVVADGVATYRATYKIICPGPTLVRYKNATGGTTETRCDGGQDIEVSLPVDEGAYCWVLGRDQVSPVAVWLFVNGRRVCASTCNPGGSTTCSGNVTSPER